MIQRMAGDDKLDTGCCDDVPLEYRTVLSANALRIYIYIYCGYAVMFTATSQMNNQEEYLTVAVTPP